MICKSLRDKDLAKGIDDHVIFHLRAGSALGRLLRIGKGKLMEKKLTELELKQKGVVVFGSHEDACDVAGAEVHGYPAWRVVPIMTGWVIQYNPTVSTYYPQLQGS